MLEGDRANEALASTDEVMASGDRPLAMLPEIDSNPTEGNHTSTSQLENLVDGDNEYITQRKAF